jgi:hypothetical protein
MLLTEIHRKFGLREVLWRLSTDVSSVKNECRKLQPAEWEGIAPQSLSNYWPSSEENDNLWAEVKKAVLKRRWGKFMLHHTQENIAAPWIKHSWNFSRIKSLCKNKEIKSQTYFIYQL